MLRTSRAKYLLTITAKTSANTVKIVLHVLQLLLLVCCSLSVMTELRADICHCSDCFWIAFVEVIFNKLPFLKSRQT